MHDYVERVDRDTRQQTIAGNARTLRPGDVSYEAKYGRQVIEECREISPVRVALEKLSQSVSDACEAADTIEKRIETALAPSPVRNDCGPLPDPGGASDVVRAIQVQTERVASLSSILRHLASRVEL